MLCLTQTKNTLYAGRGGRFALQHFFVIRKTVMDYAHLNFLEIEHLPIDVYLGLQRDAFIFNLQQTESGREYLEECWLLEQTEPDRRH